MLSKLSIRTRLGLGFATLVVLIIAIAGTAVILGAQASSSVSEMRRTSKNVVTLQQHLLAVRQIRALTWYYLATSDSQALKDVDAAIARSNAQATQLMSNTVSAVSKQLNTAYLDRVETFETKIRIMLDLKAKGAGASSASYQTALKEMVAAQTGYAAANEAAVRNVDARSSAASDEAQAWLEQSSVWSTAIGIAGILIGIVCAWLISRSITVPIGAMTHAMGALAGGDLAVNVPALANQDEIGSMAKAVQVFKTDAIEKQRLEAETEALRHTTELEQQRAEADRKVVADQQAFVVDSLASGLSRLSRGDLTCDMAEAFAPEYERLRTDFNAAVTELRGVIGTIVSNTGALRSGTTEISQAADDLSRRTEQQAASLEETAAALDEITATVRKTAEGANSAQAVVATAKADTEHSEIVVHDAMAAMSAIETSSHEIGQIISVIDEIAFQTNLLALNAGVEAARAGDAGRGFAVVASEVRALAQRSAEAAKQIKALITTSTSQVGRGVALVTDTRTALGRILNHVTKINGVVSDIAASANEQASGLAQVNTAINQMDQVTQQNAAMVEQSTAASHSLAQDTAELERLTNRFNLGADKPIRTAMAGPDRRPHAAAAKPRRTAAA